MPSFRIRSPEGVESTTSDRYIDALLGQGFTNLGRTGFGVGPGNTIAPLQFGDPGFTGTPTGTTQPAPWLYTPSAVPAPVPGAGQQAAPVPRAAQQAAPVPGAGQQAAPVATLDPKPITPGSRVISANVWQTLTRDLGTAGAIKGATGLSPDQVTVTAENGEIKLNWPPSYRSAEGLFSTTDFIKKNMDFMGPLVQQFMSSGNTQQFIATLRRKFPQLDGNQLNDIWKASTSGQFFPQTAQPAAASPSGLTFAQYDQLSQNQRNALLSGTSAGPDLAGALQSVWQLVNTALSQLSGGGTTTAGGVNVDLAGALQSVWQLAQGGGVPGTTGPDFAGLGEIYTELGKPLPPRPEFGDLPGQGQQWVDQMEKFAKGEFLPQTYGGAAEGTGVHSANFNSVIQALLDPEERAILGQESGIKGLGTPQTAEEIINWIGETYNTDQIEDLRDRVEKAKTGSLQGIFSEADLGQTVEGLIIENPVGMRLLDLAVSERNFQFAQRQQGVSEAQFQAKFEASVLEFALEFARLMNVDEATAQRAAAKLAEQRRQFDTNTLLEAFGIQQEQVNEDRRIFLSLTQLGMDNERLALERAIAQGQLILGRAGLEVQSLLGQGNLAIEQQRVMQQAASTLIDLETSRQELQIQREDQQRRRQETVAQIGTQLFDIQVKQQLGTATIEEARQARLLRAELGRATLELNAAELRIEQDIAFKDQQIERERIIAGNQQAQLSATTQLMQSALQNPFAFSAVRSLGGFPLGGDVTGSGASPFAEGLAPLGFQLPEGTQAGTSVPASTFFPEGIPTVGALQGITPSSLAFLEPLLGFTGTSAEDFGRAARGVTPGTTALGGIPLFTQPAGARRG